MEQSPSWETNLSSASQGIPRILWNLKFHYPIHKCPPPELLSIRVVYFLMSKTVLQHSNGQLSTDHMTEELVLSFRETVLARKTELLRKRPVPVLLFPPCISHGQLSWFRSWIQSSGRHPSGTERTWCWHNPGLRVKWIQFRTLRALLPRIIQNLVWRSTRLLRQNNSSKETCDFVNQTV